MSETAYPRPRKRDLSWLLASIALPLPWVLAHWGGGLEYAHALIAVLAGFAILGGAFMISWSCELAERDIPQALALLVLALVSVLPEYAVDLHFAWTAGKDPSYEAYAAANMTGANRLLIGLGWAAVVLVAGYRSRSRELQLAPAQSLELRFLIWATLYSFLIPLTGRIDLHDAVILLLLFGAYVNAARKGDTHELELAGPAALIVLQHSERGRRLWAVGLFLFAAYAIFVSAEPFADSLVYIGRETGVDEFLLVQWIAPLASESPEFVVALLFAWKGRGSTGIGALISSKVNQWTLLVGAIPITYAISLGAFKGLPLDARQTEELLLTSAQSLFGAIVISDLRFSRREALVIAALFLGQLVVPSTSGRWWFFWLYLLLSFAYLCVRSQRRRFLALLFSTSNSGR